MGRAARPSGPLEIASGNIAIAQYLGYLWPGLSRGNEKLVAVGLSVLATVPVVEG